MNERDCTTKLLALLAKTYPGAVIFKFADRFTANIPDLSITQDNQTAWLEVKKLKNPRGPLQLSQFQLSQLEIMCRLERQGLARYVVFSDKQVGTFLPSYVKETLAMSGRLSFPESSLEAIVQQIFFKGGRM